MRTYLYSATDERGAPITRQVKAASRDEALQQLRDRGYTNVKLRDVSAAVYADAGATICASTVFEGDDLVADDAVAAPPPPPRARNPWESRAAETTAPRAAEAPSQPVVAAFGPTLATATATVTANHPERRDLPVWALGYDSSFYRDLPTS